MWHLKTAHLQLILFPSFLSYVHINYTLLRLTVSGAAFPPRVLLGSTRNSTLLCQQGLLLLLLPVQRSVNLAHFSLTISFFYFYFSVNILAFLCPSVSTTSILNVVLQGAQTNREGMGGARYIKRFDWTVSAMESTGLAALKSTGNLRPYIPATARPSQQK